MSPLVEAWRARGDLVDVVAGRVWAMEAAQPGARGTPVLVLHGFPTSSFDFARVIDRLAERRRVVTFDMLGYGLSEKPAAFGYSLFEQADVATLVLRARGVTRAHVFAHDMGTTVAIELLARQERGLLPFAMESLTLMNGSVFVELAQLTVAQKILKSPLAGLFARLSNRVTFGAQMRRIFARPPGDDELDAMWELLARDDGRLRIPALSAYNTERARYRARWTGALERCQIPALVAWGRRDPVAVMAIAERLARTIPGARAETWDDLGHYPQVEDPERVARTVGGFLGSL